MTSTPFDVASTQDFSTGEMKEVEVNGQKILLVRLEDGFHAVNGRCPHYGASLAEGVLCGDRVVCPWHKAVFRVTDGELLEPPALDRLSCYPVSLDRERILIHLPTAAPSEEAAAMTEHKDERTFVLVGAGAAGTAAAERLRELGFEGQVILLSAERELPYDRTKLSKEFLSGNASPEELPLRPANFWDRSRIDRRTQLVTGVKPQQHLLVLSDGSTLRYDRLLLSPGSVARNLDVPGHDLGGIYTLRSQADAETILRSSKPGVRVAVVGGSFIALETASCFALRQLPVTVLVAEGTPLAKQLGPEVGRTLQKWHEDHGVVFRVNSKVARFEGKGVVRQVILESGEEIAADLVVVGVGVSPATEFVAELPQRADGGIFVDTYLQAAADIFVAGDSAVWEGTRIEHWRVAKQQGRTAAANMLGRSQPYRGVPYFWTNHFGTRFDYVGHAQKWDEVILEQGEEFPTFLAIYVKDGRVIAASACHRDREIAALHELMRLGRVPAPEDIRKGLDIVALV